MSFQIVLVVGTSKLIAPINIAEALNNNCPSCATTAIADQIVVTLRSQPSQELLTKLTSALSKLNALPALGANGTPAAVASEVGAVQDAVTAALNESGQLATPISTTPTSTNADLDNAGDDHVAGDDHDGLDDNRKLSRHRHGRRPAGNDDLARGDDHRRDNDVQVLADDDVAADDHDGTDNDLADHHVADDDVSDDDHRVTDHHRTDDERTDDDRLTRLPAARPGRPFERAHDVARDPAAVEVAFLRLDDLAVDAAFAHTRRIERNTIDELFEARQRTRVAPGRSLGTPTIHNHVEVDRGTLPLAQGRSRPAGAEHAFGDVRDGDVVDRRVTRLEDSSRPARIGDDDGFEHDPDSLPARLQPRRPRIVPD